MTLACTDPASAPPKGTYSGVCQECGSAFDGKRQAAKFCSPKCRMAFTNRRRDRGAELYDLFMAMRFERSEAAKAQVWSLLCDRASAYRDSDKTLRKGRKSWMPMKDAIAALPLARSEGAGDGR